MRLLRSSRLRLPLLIACVGCAQIFDIEEGTLDPDGDSGESGDSGASAEGGSGGNGGTNSTGGTSGRTGGVGGMAGSNGGSGATTSGGNGGTGAATGGNGGTVGGSGMAGKGGSSGSGVTCDCSVGSTSDTLLVSNFENRGTAVLTHAGRSGGFYSFASPDSEITETPMVECTEDDGNCYILCVSGELAGRDYPWATLAASLKYSGGKTVPYDASEYSGISFRVRGSVGANSELRAGLALRATVQADDFNDGTCVPTGTQTCGDDFVTPVTLSSNFETRAYHFFELGQGNGPAQWKVPWGVPASWDPSTLMSISWKVNSTAAVLSQAEPFQFCIDDVKFLPAMTPTQSIGFESSLEGFAPIEFDDPGATLGLSSAQHSGGAQALELLMPATTEPACTGTPTPCASLTREQCWSPGCSFSTTTSSCTGTASPCSELSGPCSAGCSSNHAYTFGIADPDMQPGDTITFRYRLPTGMLHYGIFFVADANYDWTTEMNVEASSKREEWLTGGFTIPQDFVGPVRQFGVQIVATPAVASRFYIDDVSW